MDFTGRQRDFAHQSYPLPHYCFLKTIAFSWSLILGFNVLTYLFTRWGRKVISWKWEEHSHTKTLHYFIPNLCISVWMWTMITGTSGKKRRDVYHTVNTGYLVAGSGEKQGGGGSILFPRQSETEQERKLLKNVSTTKHSTCKMIPIAQNRIDICEV